MPKSRNIPVDAEVSQSRFHNRWAATKAGAVAEFSKCFAETYAQFDDREVVYSENGAFATTSAKLGDVYPSTYRTPKSRTILSKVDSGFRRAMLQRHSLSPFLSPRRGNTARIAPCFSCGTQSRPAPRTSAVIPEWVIATSGSL